MKIRAKVKNIRLTGHKKRTWWLMTLSKVQEILAGGVYECGPGKKRTTNKLMKIIDVRLQPEEFHELRKCGVQIKDWIEFDCDLIDRGGRQLLGTIRNIKRL